MSRDPTLGMPGRTAGRFSALLAALGAHQALDASESVTCWPLRRHTTNNASKASNNKAPSRYTSQFR